MKFSTKLLSLYVAIYLIVITVVGITVTENSYQLLRQQEITRSVGEEQNIYSNVLLYLLNDNQNNDSLSSYGLSIVELFSSTNSYLEVFDQDLNLIASNSPAIWNQGREELQVAADGEVSIILRHDEQGDYYLFICSLLEARQEKLVLCMVKDINYIEEQRQKEYQFFIQAGLLGLLASGLLVAACSYWLLRPVRELDKAARNIAAGNYDQRVSVNGNDEIGSLAQQFNRMADEIEGRMQQLQMESVRQQRFVDNLTHESRTPLTSIIGYAELLQKVDYDPALFQKGLNYIYSEGKRMLNLNNMLLDLTFYREKNFELCLQPVLPICREVQELTAVRAAERNISIEVCGEELVLPLEKDLLKSLLLNLVDNAMKASPDGSSIIIGTQKQQQEKILYVQDFGRGMEAKELEKIKEPFYRVDKARSRKDGGVGLGVAICNQIASTLQGRLTYESQLQKGTIAKIYFTDEVKS
ncbi:MAG: ATP-binding protein [Peptococcaceae bacterium]